MADTLTELRTWLLRARHDAASTNALRAVSRVAIFRCAKADLRHPGYAAKARQWLRSPQAAWYAGLLGINQGSLRRLAPDA